MSPGQERRTCLAAANEARTTVEKADFMLSWRVGGDKIAAIDCARSIMALTLYESKWKRTRATRTTRTQMYKLPWLMHSTFIKCITNYAKWMGPIHWRHISERAEGESSEQRRRNKETKSTAAGKPRLTGNSVIRSLS